MFARLPFLLNQAWQVGIFASAMWPVSLVWLGLALVGVASWRKSKDGSNPSPKIPFAVWVLLLAGFPLVMLLIGSAGWEAASSAPYSHPFAIALEALAVLQLACAYLFVWNFRAHRVLALFASVLGIVWGLGAFFITGFALSGTWP